MKALELADELEAVAFDPGLCHYSVVRDLIAAAAELRCLAVIRAERDGLATDAARYRWLAGHCRSTSEHWGGRWSIVVEGPAPKSHNSEDDFDDAIDAAMKGE
jgi:hypothetical protein